MNTFSENKLLSQNQFSWLTKTPRLCQTRLLFS